MGPVTQADPLLTKPLRGRLVAPDLTDVYKYAGANPLTFTDPTGLAKKCASGDCPDCPSGFWTLTAASATVHAFFPGEAGVVTLRCKDNGKACDYAYWCFNVGPGAEAGVSVAGGMLGPFPGCNAYCSTTLLGCKD